MPTHPARRLLRLACLLALVAQTPACARAQPPSPSGNARDRYTKTETDIPMRDGIRLHTVVFRPKDETRAFPFLMERTPYSIPYGSAFPGVLGPSRECMDGGFIFVYQDVRGKFMSQGEFVNMRPLDARPGTKDIDESTDTYDTIDWLLKHVPHNNGRVGMWGISYPGFYAAAGSVHSHPALKAISPQAPCTDWFIGDDDNHNGAFFLMDNYDFEGFDRPRKGPTKEWGAEVPYEGDDAYTFFLNMGPLKNSNTKYLHDQIPFWNEMLRHNTYDAWWQARNPLPRMKGERAAALVVGGWYDAEDLYGALNMYQAIGAFNPNTPDYLVMGPWSHGAWAGGEGDHFGAFQFGTPTARTFRAEIEYPFFAHYLKGEGAAPKARVQVFETGANVWHQYAQWPPANLTPHTLYFGPDKTLTAAPSGGTYDEWVSDPARPVPYSPAKGLKRNSLYMVEDQRFAANRADVVTYQTPELDSDLKVRGPLSADLWVSTTGTDSDWVVKVIDVSPIDTIEGLVPTGVERMVRAEVFRGKFRNSFRKPEPFVPGKPTRVTIRLNDICHTWAKGHRLMVQVQSSWFPLVDRNPQTFVDIGKAGESDFKAATQRVYHTAQYPSRLTFGTE